MLELGLDGRHAFVAGVGGGIGSACVRTLAAAGARVTCFDLDGDAAHQAADSDGVNGLALTGDARRLEDVQAAFDVAVATIGPVDVAVDVIGEARWGRTIDLDDTAWDESFDLVLRHFFNLARAAGRHMAGRGTGSIVAIASVSGLRSAPLHGPYGAAKAGLMSLVRTLAVELGSDGVRVNAVAPGAVLTPRVAALMSEERRVESAASIPLGRLATPEDIARAVAFLGSDLASYVTGQTLAVDGGATAQFPLSLRVMDAAQALRNTYAWFEVNSGWAQPDVDNLAEWVADGVCRCPDECIVAPESWCEHGLASWWLIAQDLDDTGTRS